MLPAPASDDARRAAQRVEWYSTFFAKAPLVVAVTRQPYETVIEGTLADSLTTLSVARFRAIQATQAYRLRRYSP